MSKESQEDTEVEMSESEKLFEAVREEAESAAAEMRHDIGHWRETEQGWRGSCRRPGCHGHMVVYEDRFRIRGSNTVLLHRCPYRANKIVQKKKAA